YAELQVKAEAQRTAKELAYQRAYDDAFKRLYPNLMPIASSASQGATASPANQGNGRLAVFVKDDCQECSVRVVRISRLRCVPRIDPSLSSQSFRRRERSVLITDGCIFHVAPYSSNSLGLAESCHATHLLSGNTFP
ncbi:putative exported protein, partial [Pseudomonas savastanoi pv. phaseolicola]